MSLYHNNILEISHLLLPHLHATITNFSSNQFKWNVKRSKTWVCEPISMLRGHLGSHGRRREVISEGVTAWKKLLVLQEVSSRWAFSFVAPRKFNWELRPVKRGIPTAIKNGVRFWADGFATQVRRVKTWNLHKHCAYELDNSMKFSQSLTKFEFASRLFASVFQSNAPLKY